MYRNDQIGKQKTEKMGDSSSLKDFWCDRFSNIYSNFIKRDKPLPSWSDSDIDAFADIDPVHGPALKTTREAIKFAAVGSAIGAITTAGVSWKYSKSLHGTALSLGAGAVFGWTFGQEVANHYLQLYRLDNKAAQLKFLQWWETKSADRF